jgi:hypothetical protein
MTLEMKHCNGCGDDKELTEFYVRKSGLRIGKPRSLCKKCDYASGVEWKKANPEKVKAINSAWRKTNPEKARKSCRDSTYRHGRKPATENKSCSTYLGVIIAETVLAHEFPGFKRMPNCNPNYDYDCPKGFLIDVKSSCRRKDRRKNEYWGFDIRKNKVADYFLFLAFGNRDEPLVPEHIWLIPGDVVNMKSSTRITNSSKSIAKWSKYERPLDNVLKCCNKLRGET